MFKYEFQKAFFKCRGLLLLIILFVAKFFVINAEYPKSQFEDEPTLTYFNEYANEFRGELTPEKERKILAEQERIIDAKNAEYAVETRLRNGEYSSREEYITEYEKTRKITKRTDAFNLILQKYNYANVSREKRYIIAGEYNGLSRDYPDIIFLVFAVYFASTLFLTEETSSMMTLIKSYGNGRKSLCGKIFSLFSLCVLAALFIMLVELAFMISRGNLSELNYPIQSIQYFQNCPYNISILQGFLIISALRYCGILFIVALVILLSVTARKAVFVIFIPSAMCILQQFLFENAAPVYYFPTGLLRASGYLRGNAFETLFAGGNNEQTVQIFSEIPLLNLIAVLIFVALFITASTFTAGKYYSGGKNDEGYIE